MTSLALTSMMDMASIVSRPASAAGIGLHFFEGIEAVVEDELDLSLSPCGSPMMMIVSSDVPMTPAAAARVDDQDEARCSTSGTFSRLRQLLTTSSSSSTSCCSTSQRFGRRFGDDNDGLHSCAYASARFSLSGGELNPCMISTLGQQQFAASSFPGTTDDEDTCDIPGNILLRQVATIRERKRMSSLKSAFNKLRCHVPKLPYEKRLSKIETIRLAITYIGFLHKCIQSEENPFVYINRCLRGEILCEQGDEWKINDLRARLSCIDWKNLGEDPNVHDFSESIKKKHKTVQYDRKK